MSVTQHREVIELNRRIAKKKERAELFRKMPPEACEALVAEILEAVVDGADFRWVIVWGTHADVDSWIKKTPAGQTVADWLASLANSDAA